MQSARDKVNVEIEALSRLIEQNDGDISLLLQRGKLHHKSGDFESAMNDFVAVQELDRENKEAIFYTEMLKSIFEFRYLDLYNP